MPTRRTPRPHRTFSALARSRQSRTDAKAAAVTAVTLDKKASASTETLEATAASSFDTEGPELVTYTDALNRAIAVPEKDVSGSSFLQSGVGSAIWKMAMSSNTVSDDASSTLLSFLSGGDGEGHSAQCSQIIGIPRAAPRVSGSDGTPRAKWLSRACSLLRGSSFVDSLESFRETSPIRALMRLPKSKRKVARRTGQLTRVQLQTREGVATCTRFQCFSDQHGPERKRGDRKSETEFSATGRKREETRRRGRVTMGEGEREDRNNSTTKKKRDWKRKEERQKQSVEFFVRRAT